MSLSFSACGTIGIGALDGGLRCRRCERLETYPVVVDDLDNGGELAGGGAVLDEDNTANLNVSLERSRHDV